MKIALAQLNYTIGDFAGNCKKMLLYIEEAKKNKVDLVLFSELAISGYPPEDLLFLPEFIKEIERRLEELCKAAGDLSLIVGCARVNPVNPKRLLNSACLIQGGKIVDFYDKRLLPNYNVFSETRYFDPGLETKIWDIKGKKVAPTICEDIWVGKWGEIDYPIDPIALIKNKQPDLVINLSASPYYFRRNEERELLCQEIARSLSCPIVLVNQVGGNDSFIFDGSSLFVDAKGVVTKANSFQEELVTEEIKSKKKEQIEELYEALVLGTRDYVRKSGFTKVILGLSGGIDSAVVSVIAKEALGKENVVALSLPSRFTPKMSRKEAEAQAKLLGIDFQELEIDGLFSHFLDFFGTYFSLPHDETEENLQARIRGMVLMAFSNKFHYLVLAAGNKSEMAMGYMTLYGDMCGGLGVIADVCKQDVYRLANWLNQKKIQIYPSILKKAPSAELAFNQKDTDTLPEYDIVDRVVEDYVQGHLSPMEIMNKENIDFGIVQKLVHKIHQNEYKRRQAPIALRVTKRAFTKGRRFPIVQKWDQI